MLPKDLLVHLEAGDRTEEMLSGRREEKLEGDTLGGLFVEAQWDDRQQAITTTASTNAGMNALRAYVNSHAAQALQYGASLASAGTAILQGR